MRTRKVDWLFKLMANLDPRCYRLGTCKAGYPGSTDHVFGGGEGGAEDP
ncbi:MAG: hypothetical protein WBH09_06885 [Rugosibacter sp.]